MKKQSKMPVLAKVGKYNKYGAYATKKNLGTTRPAFYIKKEDGWFKLDYWEVLDIKFDMKKSK